MTIDQDSSPSTPAPPTSLDDSSNGHNNGDTAVSPSDKSNASASTNNTFLSKLLSPLFGTVDRPASLQRISSALSDESQYELARQSMSRSFSDINEVPAIDFLLDDHKEMTYSRRIALGLLHKTWYNPSIAAKKKEQETDVSEQDEAEYLVAPERSASDNLHAASFEDVTHTTKQRPSLEKAWAYFEHVALPRYIVRPKATPEKKKNFVVRAVRKFSKANKTLERAEPGEKHLPTKLYDPIFTPLKQMGDFGLGIGLYFSTLRAITILTVLAGLLNIPNLMYFSSQEYSDGQGGAFALIKGSAICTRQAWVPCLDCHPDDFIDNRIANGTYLDPSTGTNVTIPFALQNDCVGATIEQGFVNYATLIFILLGIVLLNRYQEHMEVAFDEDEQTAQDYSIIVSNPPGDATDPKEWKDFFFENFDGAHVTTCTIAVDNDFLVRSLVERRECMRKIEMMLEPGTSLDTLNLARIAAQTERDRTVLQKLIAMVAPGLPELFGRVTVLTARVQGLAQQDYPATNVFISFETEEAQRKVLTEMSVGSRQAKSNKTEAVPAHCLFRGQHVLLVTEPDEPSTVRWKDLNVKFFAKLKQLLTTTIATIAAIILIALLIRLINNTSTAFTAIAIAVFNGIFPEFAKFLTRFEAHAAEGSKQTSLYFKIAAFRWVNTAIVITIVTPFLQTLESDGLINSIYAIFFAEIVTTNAIQLLDPVGHLQRHFLAPRAATQDAMNLNMRGAEVELAERYTNMTKILFLALWYCSIFPGALFFCSFTLLINFFVDRFSLMRTWKRAPQLGTRISKFSRRYFFSSALVAMAVVSAYYWSGFPYDNLCDNEILLGEVLSGTTIPESTTWQITRKNSDTSTETSVSLTDTTYRYCLQDLLRTDGRNFPALSRNQPEGNEWMTDDQVTVVDVYGWTSVAIMLIVALKFIWGWFDSLRGLFRGTYEPSGDVQGINFSDVPSISTYVPQVESTMFSYPLVACNVDGIDEDLFDWTDPDRPYSYYDLTRDADTLLKGLDMSSKNVFSRLVHWPPQKKRQPEENGAAGTSSTS